jgi:glycerophosphoryl diester phosphodiesterase
MIERFHDAGVEVHVWTINDADDMTRLLDVGVDGIVTDRPDVALAVIAERNGVTLL